MEAAAKSLCGFLVSKRRPRIDVGNWPETLAMSSRRERLRLRPCARRALIIAALWPEHASLSDQRQFVRRWAILAVIYELRVFWPRLRRRRRRSPARRLRPLRPLWAAPVSGDQALRKINLSVVTTCGERDRLPTSPYRHANARLAACVILVVPFTAVSKASGPQDTVSAGRMLGRLNWRRPPGTSLEAPPRRWRRLARPCRR
jgi:hypothetical protein